MARYHLPYKIRQIAPHLQWVDVPTPPMGAVDARLTASEAQVYVSMRKMFPNYGGGMQPCCIKPIFGARVIIGMEQGEDFPVDGVDLTIRPTREIEETWDALLHMVYVIHPGVWSALTNQQG